jgi:hypothetical protein
MLRKIARIRHSIALNIRAIRIFRIRPPVVSLRVKIMDPAGTPVTGKSYYGDRVFIKNFVSTGNYFGPEEFNCLTFDSSFGTNSYDRNKYN